MDNSHPLNVSLALISGALALIATLLIVKGLATVILKLIDALRANSSPPMF